MFYQESLRKLAYVGVWALLSNPALAESPDTRASYLEGLTEARPEFAAATIKSASPEAKGRGLSIQGSRLIVTNAGLIDLIDFAYGLHMTQVQNLPPWAIVAKFDITAVAETASPLDAAQFKAMLQSLLESRFGMRVHHEQRALPVFELTTSGQELKLKKADVEGIGPGKINMRLVTSGMQITAHDSNMDELASVLQEAVFDRPVLNSTALSERYDFDVTFSPEGQPVGGMNLPHRDSWDAGNIFSALKELGLNLRAEKRPINNLVVDDVRHPSAD